MKLISSLKKRLDPIPVEFQHLTSDFEAEGRADFEKMTIFLLSLAWGIWTFFSPVDYFYYPDVFVKLVTIRIIVIIALGTEIILMYKWRDRKYIYWLCLSTGSIVAVSIELLIIISKDITNPYWWYFIGIMLIASALTWPTIWVFTANTLVILLYFTTPIFLGITSTSGRFIDISFGMVLLGVGFFGAHIQFLKLRWISFYNRHRAEVVAAENAKLYEEVKQLNIELENYAQNLESLVQEQVQEISEAQMAMIFALAKLAESRDDDTGRHLERIQIFCRLLAAKLGEMPKYVASVTPTFSDDLYYASPLHDIGKVGIADSILLKPAKLTPDEFEIMKRHALIGAHTLETVMERYPKNHFISMGISIARSHHERWDGTGYPDGLAGEAIPLPARIVAIVDVYDALRSNRCYKSSRSHEESRQIIVESGGTHFDPDVVQVFIELDDEIRQIRATMQD